tara:strand:+ start:540 stop:692 length:153 start_codon:yes stop_codon:yes gene_type:complete
MYSPIFRFENSTVKRRHANSFASQRVWDKKVVLVNWKFGGERDLVGIEIL